MLPFSLAQVKDFPRVVDQIFEDIETYNLANLNSQNYTALKECEVNLKDSYTTCKTLIRSFCDNITEQTISSTNVATAVNLIQRISRQFVAIRTLLGLNRSDFMILEVKSIIFNFDSLKIELNIKFFQVMSETIDNDPVLKKYHDMAVKIKADSISNARSSGKILSSIQKCIDDLGRGTRNFPFIAVVGPSLMGKTQLAYILALIQPILYFNFTPTADPQYVYSPFSGLSDAIAQAVRADLSLFKNIGSLGPSQRIIEQEINYKYEVLGCFMAFYEMYAQAFSENPNFDWMSLYAGIETFAYTSMSIHDFCKKRGK